VPNPKHFLGVSVATLSPATMLTEGTQVEIKSDAPLFILQLNFETFQSIL